MNIRIFGILLILAACLPLGGCNSSVPQARFLKRIDWIGDGQWLKADTHTHTNFSDGKHSVSEVVAKAVEHGCDVIAITDHADAKLNAATPEYAEAVTVARRQFPDTLIVAGLEWNLPPDGGDEHATVLFPPAVAEWNLLAEFKRRFDDDGRETHDEQLAIEALNWLQNQAGGGVAPVVIYNHPGRRLASTQAAAERLRFWRETGDIVVGFSGAPGHQQGIPLGGYENTLTLIDRWDPLAANLGGAWDRLLLQGIDVWAARAPSDFHRRSGKTWNDYWPGEFSETWLYVPERSASGVLRALRAGTFFAAHGHIAREVELTVNVEGLIRPAAAGETIEVNPGATLNARLDLRIPQTDWQGESNSIDSVEFFLVSLDERQVFDGIEQRDYYAVSFEVPPQGAVLRARGRRIVPDGPDLMFYTNPIRINVYGADLAFPANHDTPQAAGPSPATILWTPFRFLFGGSLLILTAMSLLTLNKKQTPQTILLTPHATGIRYDSAPRQSAPRQSAPRQSAPRQSAPRREHYAALTFIFALIAIYGSWVPFHIQSLSLAEGWDILWRTPLFQISYADRSDWATNILLFVPIGFCCLAACSVDAGERTSTVAMIPLIILGCFILSFLIEFGQLWLPQRVFSQADIAAQMIGAAVGVVAWLCVGQPVTDWLRTYTGNTGTKRQIDWLLQAYLAGLIVYSVVPLNLTINPEELYDKFRNGRVILIPFSHQPWNWTTYGGFLLDILIFIPVGGLVAIAWMPPERPLRPLPESIFLGGMLVAAIEMCQLLVLSRFTDVTDVIIGAVGVAIGAWMMHRFAPLGQQTSPTTSGLSGWYLLMLSLSYAIVLIAYFWLPYEITDDRDLIRRRFQMILGIPGASLQSVSEFRAITEILRKTLLFLPLGALLTCAVRPHEATQKKRWILLAGCLLFAGCVGLIIELGQVLIIEHTPDTSDALLCTLGAAVGIFITDRLLRHR